MQEGKAQWIFAFTSKRHLVFAAFSLFISKLNTRGFPGSTVVKNPPANPGDMGSSPGPGRSHMPRSS